MDNTGCALCKRCEGPRTKVVNGYGNIAARIMLVVDAPNQSDDYRGAFLSGSTGTLIRRMLRAAEIDEQDVYVTGATRCYTGKAPVVKELELCRPYLVEELESVRPAVVITMGAGSLRSLLDARSVVAMRGSVAQSEEFNCAVVPTFAAGIIFREPGKEEFIVADFRKAMTVLNGSSEPSGTEAIVARSLADAYRIRDILLSSAEFSFDFETTGLNYLKEGAQILCASFANEVGIGYVIPLVGEYGRKIWDDDEFWEVEAVIREILESDVPKIASNGKFDIAWAEATADIYVQGFEYDCQLMYAMVHEERPHNLEHMRTLFTNMTRYESFKDTQDYKELLPLWGYSCYPEEVLWQYAAADADCELRVARALRPILAAESQGATSVFS